MARRNPPPRRLAVLVVAAAVAVLAGGCAQALASPSPIVVRVVHAERTTSLRVRPGTTVGQVLHRSGIRPHEGQVLAASSHRALAPNGHASSLTVRGRTVDHEMTLRRPSTVVVVDGEDTVEATRTERRSIPAPGLPRALQHVHRPGKDGREEVTLGVRSKEVVARRTLVEAVPYRQATGKVVALTFDDGPSPTWTQQVLDILADRKVPAVFCEVGTQVDAHPELTRKVVARGHELCNHTQHHVEGLDTAPSATVAAEMSGGRRTLAEAAEEPRYYRPPGGSLGPSIYAEAARQHEPVLYWSLDPRDWKRPAPDQLAISVITQLEPGAIVLLHDGGGDRAATVAALPAIIDFARALGYTFTLPLSNRPQVG